MEARYSQENWQRYNKIIYYLGIFSLEAVKNLGFTDEEIAAAQEILKGRQERKDRKWTTVFTTGGCRLVEKLHG